MKRLPANFLLGAVLVSLVVGIAALSLLSTWIARGATGPTAGEQNELVTPDDADAAEIHADETDETRSGAEQTEHATAH